MNLLPNKYIRMNILRLLNIMMREDQYYSTLSRLLWLVYENKPLAIFVDDAGRVTTSPEIPIEVVYTSEL